MIASKILVIDQDILFLESILELLEDQGFKVIGAFNGILGCELAQDFHPDLITYDLGISGISDYHIFKGLQEIPIISKIPLIVMAAEQAESLRDQVLNLGARDYITKPFVIERLLTSIATLLSEKREFTKP